MKKLSKEIEQYIINCYKDDKKSQYSISKDLNIHHTTVNNILKRNNIEIKKWQYSINHNYFEKINTPDKAYFLGWMISDGCNKRRGIHINLQKRDDYILKKFKECIEYEGPLSLHKGKCKNCQDMTSLVIFSDKLSEDLNKLGVVPKKSKVTYFPKVQKELCPYVIRGIFEGDGCISEIKKGLYRVGFSGSEKLMTDVLDILKKECDINDLKLGKVGKQDTRTLVITGSYQVLRVMNYIYKDRLDLVLSRKYEKLFEIKPKLKSKVYNNMIYSINEVATKLSNNPKERLKILRILRKEK